MKTKILTDFQIYVSVPLFFQQAKDLQVDSQVGWLDSF